MTSWSDEVKAMSTAEALSWMGWLSAFDVDARWFQGRDDDDPIVEDAQNKMEYLHCRLLNDAPDELKAIAVAHAARIPEMPNECDSLREAMVRAERRICPCDCPHPLIGGDNNQWVRCRLCSREFRLTVEEITL